MEDSGWTPPDPTDRNPAGDSPAESSATPAGWYPDPGRQYQYRYWNGAIWTDRVAGGAAPMTGPWAPPIANAPSPSPPTVDRVKSHLSVVVLAMVAALLAGVILIVLVVVFAFGSAANKASQQHDARCKQLAAAGYQDTYHSDNCHNADEQLRQAEQLQQQSQQQQAIDQAAATVTDDIANLKGTETTMTSDAKTTAASDLQSQGKDLATTHAQEQTVIGEAKQYPGGNNGQVCYDANTVGYDANTVGYDANTVGYDGYSLTGDITNVRGAVTTLNTDFAQLQSDEANLPGYQPLDALTQSAVSQAASDANAAIAAAISTANSEIDQSNGDVTTAFQYVAAAYAAGNCGPPDTAPTPIAHIS